MVKVRWLFHVATVAALVSALFAARVHRWPAVLSRAPRGVGAAEGRGWVTCHGGRLFTQRLTHDV